MVHAADSEEIRFGAMLLSEPGSHGHGRERVSGKNPKLVCEPRPLVAAQNTKSCTVENNTSPVHRALDLSCLFFFGNVDCFRQLQRSQPTSLGVRGPGLSVEDILNINDLWSAAPRKKPSKEPGKAARVQFSSAQFTDPSRASRARRTLRRPETEKLQVQHKPTLPPKKPRPPLGGPSHPCSCRRALSLHSGSLGRCTGGILLTSAATR